MDILEIMRARHSVRQYLEKPIEAELREQIDNYIDELNQESGLSIQSIYDEPKCFKSFMAHYGHFVGVQNYFAIVGRKDDDEKAGYYGEKLVLKCQELGLNTCWVALTHGRTKARKNRGEKVLIIISVGYGATQGVPHKGKSLEAVCRYDEETEWFMRGMEAVLLAPTAVNQQRFFFELRAGEVVASAPRGMMTAMDLGIVKCHFEMASNHKVTII